MWGRRKTVQSWGFGERTRLGQKGSLVRGRRRGRRRRRRWGNRVIFRRVLVNYLRENSNRRRLRRRCYCRRRRRPGRRCCIGLLLQTMMIMELLLLVIWQVMMMMMNSGRFGIKIGRDAAAFFSDLNFRFLLMHYIREQKQTISPQLTLCSESNKRYEPPPSWGFSLSFFCVRRGVIFSSSI